MSSHMLLLRNWSSLRLLPACPRPRTAASALPACAPPKVTLHLNLPLPLPLRPRNSMFDVRVVQSERESSSPRPCPAASALPDCALY